MTTTVQTLRETKSSTVITPDNKIVTLTNTDFLNKFGLNFKVVKKPFFYNWNGSKMESEFFGMVRTDNGANLGVCKGRYDIRQNEEIYETLKKVCKGSDFVFEKGGVMGMGEKIYFFIKNPEDLKIGNETIKRYIFALTSHDGTSSLAFGYASTVMSCFNQFNRFYNSASLKIRHTESSKKKLSEVPNIFGKHIVVQEIIDNAFKQLAEIPLTKQLSQELMKYLLETDCVAKVDVMKSNELSTRKKNIIMDLGNSINHEVKAKGHNLFALFNGVTYYVNHKKSMRSDPTAKMESIYNGSGYKMNNQAFEWICEKASVDF